MRARLANLELYRIVTMLLIVAYHAALYSGLTQKAYDNPWSWTSAIVLWLGAWGKTGINCFVLISGYFLCEKSFSWKRILKLVGITEFYAFAVCGACMALGWQVFSLSGFMQAAFLFGSGINGSFVSSFIVLMLFAPFLNVLLRNLSLRLHATLLALSVGLFSFLPTIGIKTHVGEVGWFAVLYCLGTFVRLRKLAVWNRQRIWVISMVVAFGIATVGMLVGAWLNPHVNGANLIYYTIFPEYKLLALLCAFTAFMVFRNLVLPFPAYVLCSINVVAAGTFAIYLLHDGAMGVSRQRFWTAILDAWNFLPPIGAYVVSVSTVYLGCAFIDFVRRMIQGKFKRLTVTKDKEVSCRLGMSL